MKELNLIIRCTFFICADRERGGEPAVRIYGKGQTAVSAEMELYPLVYIAYAEPVGYFQIYIFVAKVGVQLVRISTPACIGDLYIEFVSILPCPQKYGDTGVLPGDPVPDRVLYERLQGKLGDKNLRVRTVCRDFQTDFLTETQSINGDVFPYIFDLCPDADKLVRFSDAIAHQISDGINGSGDIILFTHQRHVIYGIHGV